MAQVQSTPCFAIVEQVATAGTRQRSQATLHGLAWHPVRRQPTAAGFQNIGPGIKRLARHPERVDFPVKLRPDVGDRERTGGIGNIKTGASTGINDARCRQPVVCGHDC